jgi:hypothetical protein
MTAPTDNNSGNDSKIRLTCKIPSFYTHIFTPLIFYQKAHEFKQFYRHPQTILCRIQEEIRDLMKETKISTPRKTRLNTHLGKHQDIFKGMQFLEHVHNVLILAYKIKSGKVNKHHI